MKTNRMIFITLMIAFCLECNRHNSDSSRLAMSAKTINLSHSQQAHLSNEFHLAAWIFQKHVHDHSNNLTVKIFADNSLEKEHEVYKAIQSGNELTCAISRTTALTNFCNKIDVLHLPFLWKNYEHIHQALEGEVGKILEQELERSGFKVIAWMDSWGFQNFVTVKKDIDCLEELTHLKLHTNQSPKYIEAMKILGIHPTSSAFSTVYHSLQSGKLDGCEQNAFSVRVSKCYEVARSMLVTRHLFTPIVFIFCKSEWEKLSVEEQKVILHAAQLARDVECALAPYRDKEAMDFLAEKNMTFHSIDLSNSSEKIEQVQDKLAAECNASDLLQIIRSYKERN